ncbi:hypothetical protein NL676_021608 [Syzygium grande]|nr:hypothetical protein NL676_021608 [Syzygium grande]
MACDSDWQWCLMVVCGKDPLAQSSSQPRRDCGGSQERVAGHNINSCMTRAATAGEIVQLWGDHGSWIGQGRPMVIKAGPQMVFDGNILARRGGK